MFNITKTINHDRLRTLLGTMIICMFSGVPHVQADFDPVNDDTDIFLANPNVVAQRPNVLIYIDNTANWNSAFANEKSALKSVIDNLSDQFNVGIMMFPETGGSNDSVDGGYVRYGIRQMTNANKTVLSGMVNNLDNAVDRGNNATTGLGMVEVYRYLSGGNPLAGHGKVKSDYASNNDEPGGHPATNAGIGEHPLPASPTASSQYTSPIVHECQSNFLIYISNGPGNENQSALAEAEAELAALNYDTSNTIALTPNGQEGNWMDEWAKYMAGADINPNVDGVQNLITYVVEVDPGTSGQGDDMTALMQSTAQNGDGEYFAVSSGNNGQAIVNALNQIFQEVQAVNSVFASTTLPVSVNVRGTNLNQVYIGVFRPDSTKSPRWLGNLKMYELGFNAATGALFLADSSGSAAENPETGFINANAASFWTESSSYWGFRSPDENGPGGPSDSPDGDLVEKGGAAQQQRIAYPTDQSTRNLYTCTGACANGSSLSDTPFSTANTDISATSLQLETKPVSTLTGFDTKRVTALSDTKPVAGITMIDSGEVITQLVNTAISQNVSSLTSRKTRAISVLDDGSIDQAISSLSHPETGGAAGRRVVTAVVSGGHNLSTGSTVTISGAIEPGYNGTFVITVTDSQTFTYNAGSAVQNSDSPASGSPVVTSTSTVITATVPAHGFESGNQVIIAGVNPTSYNDTYNLNKIDDDTFSFTVSSALPPISSIASATATSGTTTATATVAAHGYVDGSAVTIGNAAPAGFNGTQTITVLDANTFTYPLTSSSLGNASGTITATQGTSLVTVNTLFAHNISPGQTVAISGAVHDAYNGIFTATSVTGPNTFLYDTGEPLPPTLLDSTGAWVHYCSAACTSTALAVVNNHRLSELGTPAVVIEGADPASYNSPAAGSFMVDTVETADSFTYPTTNSADAATGEITMRISSPATAFATVAGHGYATGDAITVQGADKTQYNVTDASVTVFDANTFAYTHGGSGISTLGEAAGTITASKKTITARARAVAHGFATGSTVTIAGATPAAFNGDFTITKVDDNNFTYTLPSAQGNAAGGITASTGTATGAERDNLINWVRGADNFEDENADGSNTDIRSSIHGDVLHSRPAVVNYNRFGNDDDIYVYYGSNDGIFRAVKGGKNQSDASEPHPGQEVWGFIPEEHFPDLQRLRNNEPMISSANKKPYFADGTIIVHTQDNNADGKIDVTADDDANPDVANLFITMRRGGRLIYALDVSDPVDPKLLWKKTFTDLGFAELGYTWSAPTVTRLAANGGEPVLIFGAGYDPAVEDVTPSAITAVDSTSVSAGAANYVRSMGRGIYVLDAATGDPLWQAGPTGGAEFGISHPYVGLGDMNYSIPSDVVVITDRSGSVDNRAYVGDTGGNMWRLDLSDADPANWKVTRLASVANTAGLPADASGLRKFLFPPDVVYSDDGYDAVLIGSGDREHPFDTTVENRFYMFKDPGVGVNAPKVDTTIDASTGMTTDNTNQATLTEPVLFDATSNCIQFQAACSGSGDELDSTTAANALNSADGWYITLADGEKVVGNSVTLNNVTFFNTNQPETAVISSDCSSNLGVARQYKVQYANATSFADQNIDGYIDADDRFTVHPGGGYLPSPVPVVVEIDGQIHEGVISGVAVEDPPGSVLNARLRKFWYKEIE